MKKLFYIETQYQFLVSLSIVLSSEFSKPIEAVFIDATKNNFFFSNRDFIFDAFNVEVLKVEQHGFYHSVFTSFFKCKKFKFDKNNTSFFFFTNRSPLANKISSFYKKEQTFLVEEGLSLYRSSLNKGWVSQLYKLIKQSIISIVTICHYRDDFGKAFYASNVFLRYEELYMENSGGKPNKIFLLPDITLLASYRGSLNELFDLEAKLPIFEQGGERKKVLFLGQPLTELGLVPKENESYLLFELAKLISALDMDMVIKAHPKDNISKYDGLGGHIITGDIPAELMYLDTNNYVGVFSFYSTAAINAAFSFGMPVFFLFELLPALSISLNIPEHDNLYILKKIEDCRDFINAYAC